MPRYRGNLNDFETGGWKDLTAEKLSVTLETFSGDIKIKAWSSAPTTGDPPVDQIEVSVRAHGFRDGGRPDKDVVLYSGPIHALHDETKRDVFVMQLAQAKLKKEYGQ